MFFSGITFLSLYQLTDSSPYESLLNTSAGYNNFKKYFDYLLKK